MVAGIVIVAMSSIRPDLLARPASHLSPATETQAKETFDPLVVRELDCRRFKAPGTPPVQYKIWIGKPECEVASWDKSYYFELDFYRLHGRRIPVFVIASKHSLQTNHRILYVLGGPRLILTDPNDVMKDLVKAGWTIFLPIYQGLSDSAYPHGDSEGALKDIAALRRLVLHNSDLVIGESVGGYLAAADCLSNGGNQRRLLLEPLVLAPADQFDVWRRSFDSQTLATLQKPLCIRKVGSTSNSQVCAPYIQLQEGFWGKYRNTSVNDLLSKSSLCRSKTSILISPDDHRIYSASAVNALKSRGVAVTEVPHLTHEQMVSDAKVVDLVRNWAER